MVTNTDKFNHLTDISSVQEEPELREKLFSVNDLFGSPVCLYNDRWELHIAPSHQEVSVDLVELTVENPHLIFSCITKEPKKQHLAFGIGEHCFHKHYLLVIVRYDMDQQKSPGEVMTAFYTPKLKVYKEILFLRKP